VAFHGYTAYATELEATSGLSALADEEGFVVAHPQAFGSTPAWHIRGDRSYDPLDVTMTQSLVSLLIDKACVDPGRVYLAGHSMGGAMASDAACRLADGSLVSCSLPFSGSCFPASRCVPSP